MEEFKVELGLTPDGSEFVVGSLVFFDPADAVQRVQILLGDSGFVAKMDGMEDFQAPTLAEALSGLLTKFLGEF